MATLTLRIAGLGHNLTLNVSTSATVGELKRDIEARTSLPAAYQRLLARGKKLDDDEAPLGDAGIEDRTKLMLLHSPTYATDRDGVDAISALTREIDDLNSKVVSMEPTVVHEMITQICCKLDGVDTHGSENLRMIRKAAIEKAEAVGRRADDESK